MAAPTDAIPETYRLSVTVVKPSVVTPVTFSVVAVGDGELSLNEQMITEGYAWPYAGGTKKKDFEELREIRKAHGTLV
ncbi:endonuclease [Synechococcus phage S-B43]|nr:endonuclease [Synechococcus phage S-B43]